MTSWLSQHRYALAVTLRRLGAHPFSSLANILVIALALSLSLIGACLLSAVQPVVRQVSITPELTVFLKPDALPGSADAIASRIRKEHPNFSSALRVVPKEQALKTLRENPAWEQALRALPSNPLPDAVVVTMSTSEDLVAQAKRLAQDWTSWDAVDLVQIDSAWVQRLEAILRFAKIGFTLLGLSVALVVLATIFNTVRMQALSQREEIAVARLVGATEAFVRRPFLYLGTITCVLSCLLAVLIAHATLIPLNAALGTLAHSYDAEFAIGLLPWPTLLASAIATAALGALSARWSVTRHTNF